VLLLLPQSLLAINEVIIHACTYDLKKIVRYTDRFIPNLFGLLL
jgi:hypothetical protein